MKFRKEQKVQWQWLGRSILGTVVEVFVEPVVREIKGKKIKRNGSAENPAYLVRSEAGNEALKLGTELKARSQETSARKTPKMFS